MRNPDDVKAMPLHDLSVSGTLACARRYFWSAKADVPFALLGRLGNDLSEAFSYGQFFLMSSEVLVQKAVSSSATKPLLPTSADISSLDHVALLLDIDGTLLELAPTPRDVVVPPKLGATLQSLYDRTSGALALVSGRSLTDIDMIFAPNQFPAVGGHGAEMRLSTESEAVAARAAPMDTNLKKRFAAIAQLSPGIILEDKGYSIALHYRLAPQFERTIYEAVSAIRADLPQAAFEVLPGKSVCEIKPTGITKATGVKELMTHAPFAGRHPVFIGDDVTDESVFAIMPAFEGVSFSVGRRAHGVDGFFNAPKDVRAWLTHLLDDDAVAI